MFSTNDFSFILLLFSVAIRPTAASTTRHDAVKPIHAFAVGFDLTDSYGTASVRLAGGDVQLAARVEGDDQYIRLMQRLALNSSRHMSPPYEWWHDGGAIAGTPDIPRQMLRRARKAIGLPASNDVGILSAMLSALHGQTEQALSSLLEVETEAAPASGITFDSIMLTSPELPGLYDEDLDDAALHSGLKLLQLRSSEWGYRYVPDPDRNATWMLSPWILRQPKHAHALFTASGLAANLHHPLSPSADPNLKKHTFLLVHLTRHGLELWPEIKNTNRTCGRSWGQHMGWYNASLAWPSILSEAEWQQGVTELVRNAIWNQLRMHYANGYQNNITNVLFAGESGALPLLHETVLDYIHSLPEQSIEPRVWPHVDAHNMQDLVENGASYGAAMMAWQFVAEKPLEGEFRECSNEDSRNMDYGSDIRYPTQEGSATSVEYIRSGNAEQEPLGSEL